MVKRPKQLTIAIALVGVCLWAYLRYAGVEGFEEPDVAQNSAEQQASHESRQPVPELSAPIPSDDSKKNLVGYPISNRKYPSLTTWVTDFAAQRKLDWQRSGFVHLSIPKISQAFTDFGVASLDQDLTSEERYFNIEIFPGEVVRMKWQRLVAIESQDEYSSWFGQIVGNNDQVLGRASFHYAPGYVDNGFTIVVLDGPVYELKPTDIENIYFAYQAVDSGPIGID